MKIFKVLFCMIAIVLTVSVNAYADSQIKIKVNERTIAMDVNPYISGNHTLVPIRFIATALDCDEIIWNENEKTVTIKDNGTEIVLKIDSSTALVNNNSVALGTNAKIKNNRTYIPVRFVAENMGAIVNWNEKDRIVDINKEGVTNNIPYAEDELFWMARIIHAEARGESFEGKVAVGNVVLNRVKSKLFPDTIYGVIFDRSSGIQFTPVANGTIYNDPSNECYYAADQALRGKNVVGDSLFFCNPKTSTSSWVMRNRVFFIAIGNHNFYL